MLKYYIFIVAFFFIVNWVSCKSRISKCTFYDKRNSELKQTFYIPSSDVSMYKATIEKLLSRELNLLDEPIESNESSEGKNVTNLEDIKQKEEKKKNKEMEEKLKYIEKYRNYAKSVLKNVEFKCETIDDYEAKIKCNLCIYTEIVNNKHIRQGQVVQIFMNECIYGFYYYDNITQYTENNEVFKSINDENTETKIDDIYFNITKDVAEGNTNQINFFRQESSKYHPVCYVTE
ncbi:conserved Plasmodium protein, unknown function [Plasmodium relictum]|uniref:Uncharacterized protein n=1 Tax=Plasmodium relictum TaxID=85471 RepID=A0A1J1HGN2_PLARL|nr:conserved Plasmodium protein, unknown function [Plasmodium relictum]CRH02997.1 conserved Plasmodium protein, unknown function [Plasmodium relictum]